MGDEGGDFYLGMEIPVEKLNEGPDQYKISRRPLSLDSAGVNRGKFEEIQKGKTPRIILNPIEAQLQIYIDGDTEKEIIPYPTDAKLQIYIDGDTDKKPLNIQKKTLEYLLNVDLEKLLLYKYLTTEGSQQPAAGATYIFNEEIRIPLNGGSDAERIFNLHHQAEYKEGEFRAIYGPEGSGIDQIMNELGEIERGLNEHGIRVDKRTGGIVIDDVVLSPGEVRSVLEAAELYQLFEEGHSNAYGRKQHEFLQPCVDKFGENVLTRDIGKGYEVIEVFSYPGDLFGVKAIKSLPEAESLPQM